MGLITMLTITALGLLLFGIIYAVFIYHRGTQAFPHGWTWASVVIGDLVTDFGSITAIVVTLSFFDLIDQLWWVALVPIASHLCTGIPMIILQNKKRLDQHANNNSLVQEIKSNGKKSLA